MYSYLHQPENQISDVVHNLSAYEEEMQAILRAPIPLDSTSEFSSILK